MKSGISLAYRFTYYFHVRVHGFCSERVATKHKVFILCKRKENEKIANLLRSTNDESITTLDSLKLRCQREKRLKQEYTKSNSPEAYTACDGVGVSIMEIRCRNQTTKMTFVKLSNFRCWKEMELQFHLLNGLTE